MCLPVISAWLLSNDHGSAIAIMKKITTLFLTSWRAVFCRIGDAGCTFEFYSYSVDKSAFEREIHQHPDSH